MAKLELRTLIAKLNQPSRQALQAATGLCNSAIVVISGTKLPSGGTGAHNSIFNSDKFAVDNRRRLFGQASEW